MNERITITTSLPAAALRPNGRHCWQAKARAKAKARLTAAFLATEAIWTGIKTGKSPRWPEATVQIVGCFKTATGMDPDNLLASCKAHLDGLKDAGLIADDNRLTILPPQIRKDAANPRLVIEIWRTEPMQRKEIS